MLCSTFRSILLGILFTCLESFITQFFAYRTLPLDTGFTLIIILSYFIGNFMSKVLPSKFLNIPLNPRPFTIKENALIALIATSGKSILYAIEAMTVQRVYYEYYL